MKQMTIILMILFVCISAFNAQAQNVDDYLTQILEETGYSKEDYVKGYLQPLSTSLGTSLSGAMYHRGSTKSLPRFDVGIKTVFIPLPDEAKSFDINTNSFGTLTVPTVFGAEAENNQLGIPGGFDNDFFALPVLHANVGLAGNLEATARFATANTDIFGDLVLYGAGLKYGLSDLIPIPMFPVDFAVQGSYHKFAVGDFMDAGTFNMNFQASAGIPLSPISFYGGIGYDNSTMVINTDELVPGNLAVGEVSINGENNVRFNVGVSFTLLFFNVHADYALGKYNSINGGLMLVL
ncbi:MAG: hypothetical protein GF313_07720 [Caldithrix sp.]|nr:hypothetical protein [Caldithrix sp.]